MKHQCLLLGLLLPNQIHHMVNGINCCVWLTFYTRSQHKVPNSWEGGRFPLSKAGKVKTARPCPLLRARALPFHQSGEDKKGRTASTTESECAPSEQSRQGENGRTVSATESVGPDPGQARLRDSNSHQLILWATLLPFLAWKSQDNARVSLKKPHLKK